MRCKKCGASILFIRTTAGKNMPVNARVVFFNPDDQGKDRIMTEHGELLRATISTDGERLGYMPHFATCAKAKETA